MQSAARILFVLWLTTAALQSFALNIDGNPVFYYFMIQVLLMGVGIFCPTRSITPNLKLPISLLVVFLIIAAIGAFYLPVVFQGTPAFVPRISIDEQMRGMSLVQFSFSNVVQVIYLTINVILVFFAAQGRFGDLSRQFWYGAAMAAAIICFSIFAEWAEISIWTDFLADIVRNNEAGAVFDNLRIDSVRRISGSFSEPSYAGVFSSALMAYFATMFLNSRRWIDLFLAIAMLLCAVATTSLLGFVGILVGLLLIVFRYSRRYFIPLAVGFATAVGYYFIVGIEFIDRLYLSRSGDSAINRLTSDQRSLEIASETYMIGVGLGSHRASSLLSTMLANTGLVGAVLYLAAIGMLLLVAVAPQKRSVAAPLRHFAIVAWAALLLGAPELSTPTFWTAVVALVSVAASGAVQLPVKMLRRPQAGLAAVRR